MLAILELRRWIENPKFVRWVLAVQLLVLSSWSTFLTINWQIHKDFAVRYQGVVQASRGIFSADGSLVPWGFLQDHFELINYLVLPLIKLPLHFAYLLYLQNLFIILGEWAGISLLRLLLQRLHSLTEPEMCTAASLAVVVQVLNPWVYMAASDDVHFFSIGAMASTLASLVRLLQGNKWSALIWLIVALACGDTVVIYLIGASITYCLIHRGSFKLPLTVIFGSTVWLILSSKLGLTAGSNFSNHFREILGSPHHAVSGFDVLVNGILHPTRLLHQIVRNSGSLWGFVGAGGVIGLLTPVSILVWMNLIITGIAHGNRIAATPWENPASVLLLSSCSCYVLYYLVTKIKLPSRKRLFKRIVFTALILNSATWFVLWAPYSWHSGFLTSRETVSELNRIESRINSNSQVVVSQGICGRFADHRWLYVTDTQKIPIKTKVVHFVLTPFQGLETRSTAQETNLAQSLLRNPFVKLRSHDAGVWWFTLHPPANMRNLNLKTPVVASPGWAMLTSIGDAAFSRTGLPEAMSSDGSKSGYLTYGAVWGLKNGRWVAKLDMDTKTSFYVEIGDFSKNLLFARNHFVPTTTRTQLSVPFTVKVPPWSRQGWGPFSYLAPPPRFPANIEARVFVEEGGAASLYSISILKVPDSK